MTVAVRYIVDDVDAAIPFYVDCLGFTVEMRPAPGFAALRRGDLRLFLNQPGAGGAGQARDGAAPAPGGWSRFQITVEDIESKVSEMKAKGVAFRGDIVVGNGGKQALVQDPSGNLVELLEPARRA